MQNRFEFLKDRFPKLAEYGEKAGEAIEDFDYNLCLLNLGRIAENITEFLCRANHLDKNLALDDALDELIRLEVIDEKVKRKINTLLEIKDEAEENDYDSKTASILLMKTAQELCEWFMLKHGEGKFEFLADLFIPGRFVPPLANLSEIGREAEENLFTNTRYCLICLGDIGEAIVDYLLNMNNIETHEREQLNRIDALFNNYVINDDIKDRLHNLRVARNKAVHERYDNTYTSEDEAVKLLDEVLKLCRWLFKLVLKPGYIVKGRISEISDDSISVLIGQMKARVPLDEIPSGDPYIKGRKYIFKFVEKEQGENEDDETLILSLRQADEDYNVNIAQKYSKYKIGQDVHVFIKRISNSSGALVELKDGLLAQIPPSEIGKRLYDYDESNTKQIKYEITARVKWFNLTKYPPMLLSVKDIENENKAKIAGSKPDKWEQQTARTSAQAPKNNKARDLNFRTLCRTADFEKILELLNAGANPNATNNNNTTALMMAAQTNRDPKVAEILIDSGAELEARNHNGNTALHFAAMENIPEVVKVFLDKGADIEALNHEKKMPFQYALYNKNLNSSEIMKRLTPASEADKLPVKAKPSQKNKPKAKSSGDKTEDNLNSQLLLISKNGTPEEIELLINQGADVDTVTQNRTTPLMIAAQYNNAEAVKAFIENGAELNIQNKTGNTALHFAASNNSSDVVMAIINAGAALNIKNKKGKTPLDCAKENGSMKDSPALKKLNSAYLQREFLKICRSGTESEISEAIASGANVNSKNKALSSALMFAARDNTAYAVSLLIESGAYINAQDIYGNTALIYAASSNTEDVVELLIEAGADIELTNTSGFSAFDYGKKNEKLKNTETLKRLEITD